MLDQWVDEPPIALLRETPTAGFIPTPAMGGNWRERYSKMTIQLGPIPLLVAIIYLQKAGMIIMGDKTH